MSDPLRLKDAWWLMVKIGGLFLVATAMLLLSTAIFGNLPLLPLLLGALIGLSMGMSLTLVLIGLGGLKQAIKGDQRPS